MKLEPVSLRDVSEGVVQGVDNSITPPNAVYLAVNLVFDKVIGRAKLRSGTTLLGAQVSDNNACLGLYQHTTASGTKVPLSVFNTVLYKYTSSTWSSAKTGLTAAKMRFETFLDTTVGVNGTDIITSTDGATWNTTGGDLDISNMPSGVTLIKEFQDKVYVAGKSGNLDRLYYSSTPTAGAVSWTSGNGFIDIEAEEGAGAITALAKVPGYLLIFKERSMKRWDGSSTYPESLITIGAPSQEAVVQARQSVFYFNKRGVFETTGGYPRKVSRRIQDIIDAIPSSYYSSVSGGTDGERVFWSIGDITLDDLTLTNCVIIYNLDSQNWSLLSFPNEFKRFAIQVDSNGDEIVLGGDDDGNVWKVFSGTADGSTPINYLLQYHPQEFSSRGRKKELSKFVVYNNNVKNGQLSCRIDGNGSFQPVGIVNKNEHEMIKDLKGRFFEFRVQGSGQDDISLIGIDFPEVSMNLNFTE